MKRKLQLAIVIGVSVAAGAAASLLVNVAKADGPRGMKFGGMSSGNGGGSNRGGMQFNQGGNPLGGSSLGGQAQIRRIQGNGQSGGSVGGGFNIQKTQQPNIRIGIPQNLGGNHGAGGQNGNSLPQNILKGNIRPSIATGNASGGNKTGIHVGGSPIGKQIGQQLGNQIGNQIGNKIGKIDPGFGQTIDKHFGGACKIGDKVCDPHCKPGHKPHCPTIWWYPSHCGPCHKPCYPTTVVTKTVVVQVPVAVVGQPAPAAEAVLQIPVGSSITLQGQAAPEAGQVILQFEKVSMPVQVNDWKSDAISLTLPMLGLEGPVRATLWMVNADGTLAGNVAIELIAAQPVAEVAQASALEGVTETAADVLFGTER
jgi:hypothetical protein